MKGNDERTYAIMNLENSEIIEGEEKVDVSSILSCIQTSKFS